MEVKGANTVTISQGKIVYQDGDVRTVKGAGRYINRPPFTAHHDALKVKAEVEKPVAVKRGKKKAA